MKCVVLQGGFGLERLEVVERPRPVPGPGQVLVQTRACALNYRDLLMVRGSYNPKQPLPLIPLSDGVGEIVEVGEGVTQFETGARVTAGFMPTWTGGPPNHTRLRTTLGGPLDGWASEYKVISADGLTTVPAHLTDAEAATLPCAGVTAWAALTKYRRVVPGDTVLIQGTGGVSLYALQLSRLLGARTIITSSSDDKLAKAKALGADELINYRDTPEWEREVRRLTARAGADHIIEVGGADTFQRSLRSVRVGGFIAVIGVLGGHQAPIDLRPVLMSSITVQGVTVGSLDDLREMNRAIAAHDMRPVIDRRFPLAELGAALEYLGRGRHFGKVVIEPIS